MATTNTLVISENKFKSNSTVRTVCTFEDLSEQMCQSQKVAVNSNMYLYSTELA